MAGGSGERFWPLSSKDRPKQLLKLSSADRTMLEEAVDRVHPLVGPENVYISTSPRLSKPIGKALRFEDSRILAEPLRRNTLGALCWVAASLLATTDGNVSVVMVTSDHAIGTPDAFRGTLEAGFDIAEVTEGLVAIGIPPNRPETGFGYIELKADETVSTPAGRVAYRSRSFHEKPSREVAEGYLAAGNFVWNAGMLAFTLNCFMRELRSAQFEAHEIVSKMAQALKSGDRGAAVALFEALPNISIDYAVLERASKVFVVHADFPWDDVGAWDALERSRDSDAQGNVVEGNATLIDSTNCVVYNETPTAVVSLLGVHDLVVVATQDGILVCPKDHAQRVKEIVARLDAGD